MSTKTPIDLCFQICAERDAIAKLFDFYWARVLKLGTDDSSYEQSRLLELEALHKKQDELLRSFPINIRTQLPEPPTE